MKAARVFSETYSARGDVPSDPAQLQHAWAATAEPISRKRCARRRSSRRTPSSPKWLAPGESSQFSGAAVHRFHRSAASTGNERNLRSYPRTSPGNSRTEARPSAPRESSRRTCGPLKRRKDDVMTDSRDAMSGAIPVSPTSMTTLWEKFNATRATVAAVDSGDVEIPTTPKDEVARDGTVRLYRYRPISKTRSRSRSFLPMRLSVVTPSPTFRPIGRLSAAFSSRDSTFM